MNENPDSERYKWLRVAGDCSFIPIYLALYPVVFRYIGVWLDGKFGTQWLQIAFLFLGIFSGFRQTYFVIKRLMKAME